MSRLPHLAIFSFAAVHLLLFSICPASSRIYRTDDAIVIEVDDDTRASKLAEQPSFRFARSNFGNPPPIPMMYAVNPYTGLSYLQQPNFPFWPYPLYRPTSSFSDVKNVTATSADSRQQTIPCGVGPDSPPQRTADEERIVGGTTAKPYSWPFIVGLRIGSGNVSCGGSIISRTRILTAAHCVNEISLFEISTMTVSLGMHTQGNLKGTSNDAEKTRRVSRVVYHINYNSISSYNDIAILTIDPPINYSKRISPVCLPPGNPAADQFVGKDAAIMGWGALKTKGDTPNELQENTLSIISNADCKRKYSDITDAQLCAIAPGKDTCQGDSGGPMVVQLNEASWTQVGAVSYGKGCAVKGIPGVYASVPFYRKWIDKYAAN